MNLSRIFPLNSITNLLLERKVEILCSKWQEKILLTEIKHRDLWALKLFKPIKLSLDNKRNYKPREKVCYQGLNLQLTKLMKPLVLMIVSLTNKTGILQG